MAHDPMLPSAEYDTCIVNYYPLADDRIDGVRGALLPMPVCHA
jgi:hypothetical protein